MNDAQNALSEIDRQRAALADRVRLPLWYRTLWAVALVALFAVPLFATFWSSLTVFLAVQLQAIVVLSPSGVVLYRSSGACLARNTTRAYPSSRWPMAAMVATIVVGAGIESAVLFTLSTLLAAIVGGLAVVGAVTFFDRYLGGIRSDIRRGRVVAA